MKKKLFVLAALAVVLAVSAAFLWPRGGDVQDVRRISSESSLYSEEDIHSAMDIAIEAFSNGFKGCKLLSIAYDEAETLAEIERQRERYGEIKFLILVSELYAGDEAEGAFEPGTTYGGWKWIFRNDGDSWLLVSWGYA